MRMSSMLSLFLVPGALAAQTLRGSRASVELMYASAHEKDLAFLHSRGDIYEAAKEGDLQLISISNDVTLQYVKFPFVLPTTLAFTDSLGAAFRAACGERLVVTSGSRPQNEQPRNASPKSVHPTGMAVDFRKPTGNCLKWLRASLLGLEARGVIEATEERRPAHFHVAVLRQEPVPPTVIATAVAESTQKTQTRVAVSTGEVAKPALASEPAKPTSPTAEASTSYRVRAGDNLWTIARKHGTTTKRLEEINSLESTRLRVGQRLKLPR
jgi:hypothetical protein